MFNGFTISDGDLYASKAGHDSNVGDLQNPKRSIVLSPNKKTVIGTGVHFFNSTSNRTNTVVGDGKVIVYTSGFRSGGSTYTNIEFRGLPGANLISYNVGDFNDCILKDFNCSTAVTRSNRSIWIDCQKGVANTSSENGHFSIFIRTTIYFINILKNNYVDPNSVVSYFGFYYSFLNNNIQGIVILEGQSYAIQDQFIGTPQDNGYAVGVQWLNEANLTANGYSGTIAGWDASIATCMNRPPLFNNPAIGDYSLQAGSPMVGKADDGISNIGGQKVGLSYLVSQHGVGETEVIPSSQIDVTNPNSFSLKPAETEGYIDYIVKLSNLPVTLNSAIEPISDLLFNSDQPGGSAENNNVVDSNPTTTNYPDKLTTNAAAPNDTTLKILGHGQVANKWVRVLGEDRQISAIVDVDTFEVANPFRAIVGANVEVKTGTETQLAALNPNTLTYLLRTSKQTTKPAQDSEWDNDIDPIYAMQGQFLTQRWFEKPQYIISLGQVYGDGDPNKPQGIVGNEIQATYLNLRVYIRNNYAS